MKALRQTEDELTKEADSRIVYIEVDGTDIHLQHEEKKRAELKLGIISKGKERRYKEGKSEAKKLQDKFTYTDIVSGDEFMSNLAILGEKRFHLERKLKQTLPYHKEMQKEIRNLLKEGEIDKTLKELGQERSLKPEHKKDVEGLMHYIYYNQEGVNAVDRLRKQGIPVEDLEAVEGNIDKSLANRFQKRGMRWIRQGALNLAKIGEKIVNNEWDSW